MSKGSIILLHPDLGLGGAERLVVDAALALKRKNYDVKFVTSHHNEEHCFEETRDGTLDVVVVGDWIPRHFYGRLFALFAYLRMIYCAFYIIFFMQADCIFCDLVSVSIPILHLTISKVIFYCHFPDQLLSKPEGKLKRIYRVPLNWLEEKTTNCADKVYVNSHFTKGVVANTFNLSKEPSVLYPSMNTSVFTTVSMENTIMATQKMIPNKKDNSFIFLSINRFERKKHIELALQSFKELSVKLSADDWNRVLLILAGGHDPRVEENVEYSKELQQLGEHLNIQDKVYIVKSPSDIEKISLLKLSDCVLYTPPNEHFGIVPLEAMYAKKPVIALNSGGPKETVLHEQTGFLCEMDVSDFSDRMAWIVKNKAAKEIMGEKGHQRFVDKFSFEAFSDQLDKDMTCILENDKRK